MTLRPYDDPMASLAGATHGELLSLAASGDQAAWNALVERFSQMVWSIARSFRLDDATAKDVSQTVWLRLVENLHRIDDPERLPGWLATTCRREALRVKGMRDRVVPTDFQYDVPDESLSLESMLVEDEEAREVVVAFGTLSQDCQQLLRLLTTEPPLSYEEISEMVGRPIGSLGPTRSRCLERLKAALSARISGAGSDSLEAGDDAT
jgi:RNA polymerase sigma factor (sigma-70 family)